MKVIWESQDVVPGQRVGSPARAEQWLIGYMPADNSRALISLSDGMISKVGSAEEIANLLNASGDAPIELLERKHK